MTAKRTQGEWRTLTQLDGSVAIVDENNRNILNRSDYKEQESNASFIVLACNAHEDLVTALKDALRFSAAIADMTKDGEICKRSLTAPGVTIKTDSRTVTRNIRSALAKAEK